MLIKETPEQKGSTYTLWADLTPCEHPRDFYNLVFYSTWSGSKNPEIPQVKARFVLDQAAIDNLKELLENK